MGLFGLFGAKGRKAAVPAAAPVISNEPQIPVRFDGIYCFIYDNDKGLKQNSAMRFYEGGAVISTTVCQLKEGDGYFPKSGWFNRDQDSDNSGGRWRRNGNKIDFFITVSKGNIIYKGSICEDKLVLDSYSQATGFRRNGAEFVFIPFSEVPGW